jgi:hypothetical protein
MKNKLIFLCLLLSFNLLGQWKIIDSSLIINNELFITNRSEVQHKGLIKRQPRILFKSLNYSGKTYVNFKLILVVDSLDFLYTFTSINSLNDSEYDGPLKYYYYEIDYNILDLRKNNPKISLTGDIYKDYTNDSIVKIKYKYKFLDLFFKSKKCYILIDDTNYYEFNILNSSEFYDIVKINYNNYRNIQRKRNEEFEKLKNKFNKF